MSINLMNLEMQLALDEWKLKDEFKQNNVKPTITRLEDRKKKHL